MVTQNFPFFTQNLTFLFHIPYGSPYLYNLYCTHNRNSMSVSIKRYPIFPKSKELSLTATSYYGYLTDNGLFQSRLHMMFQRKSQVLLVLLGLLLLTYLRVPHYRAPHHPAHHSNTIISYMS